LNESLFENGLAHDGLSCGAVPRTDGGRFLALRLGDFDGHGALPQGLCDLLPDGVAEPGDADQGVKLYLNEMT